MPLTYRAGSGRRQATPILGRSDELPSTAAPELPRGDGITRPRRISFLPLAVLLAGAAVVALLTWASIRSYQDTENRLLSAKGKEAAAVLQTATQTVQIPLTGAAGVADLSSGNAPDFARYMKPFVGSAKSFVAASLWRLGQYQRGPIATVGAPLVLSEQPQALAADLERAAGAQQFVVVGPTPSPNPRLGYAFHAQASPYVIYAEAMLPANRRARIASDAAFSDIHYAIYLGPAPSPANLLTTDVNYPLTAHKHSANRAPFGDSTLTILVSPRTALPGGVSANLPWFVGVGGTALAIGGAIVAEWLQRRRQEARELYAQQRTVAETLQEALLPTTIARPAGLDVAYHYEPGAAGLDIGGDWYDLVPVSDGKVFFVVGDVSGRGVQAAAVMAQLRFAVLSYVHIGDPPETILKRISELVSIEDTGHFATVICGLIDVDRHEVTMANAGHLPLLLLADGEAMYLSGEVGLPIGVDRDQTYQSVSVRIPARSTLLAFTDGLVERRTESLEHSLEQLGAAASSRANNELPDLVGELVARALSGGTDDDAAILAVRWQS